MLITIIIVNNILIILILIIIININNNNSVNSNNNPIVDGNNWVRAWLIVPENTLGAESFAKRKFCEEKSSSNF